MGTRWRGHCHLQARDRESPSLDRERKLEKHLGSEIQEPGYRPDWEGRGARRWRVEDNSDIWVGQQLVPGVTGVGGGEQTRAAS